MSDAGFTTFFGDRFDRIALSLPKIFGPLGPDVARAFKDRVQWIELSGGETLFSQGDPGDCMYLVAGGRLQAVVRSGGGVPRVVGEIAQGEPVGEMALLTGQPRVATICAARDSLLMRLDRDVFEDLVREYPDVLLNISRKTVERLSQSSAARQTSPEITNVTILPVTDGLSTTKIAERLAEELRTWGAVAYLNPGRIDRMTGTPGRAQASGTGHEHVKLSTWLDRQSLLHRFVIYEAESQPTPWTRRCVRQADRILLVAAADADPTRSALEHSLLLAESDVGSAPCELLLVHPEAYLQPTATARWYHERRLTGHHHLRPDKPTDWCRLARFLAGTAVGIVFAGGGARGFAHIGVVRALREAGITLDMAGGTSMGAIIAAGVANDWDQETFFEVMRNGFTGDNPLNDYNLVPTVSLLKGHKIDRLLQSTFGENNIEDLWLPFFCVSSNLTQAEMTVHQNGTLWRAVRASLSLPGILPPVVIGNDLHVDGATFNNFPIDVMRSLGAGRIIAVDIDIRKSYNIEYSQVPSSWEVFKNRVSPGGQRLQVPGLVQTVMKASVLGGMHQRAHAAETDLYLSPDVMKVPLLDLKAFDDVVEIGYRHASERLENFDIQSLL